MTIKNMIPATGQCTSAVLSTKHMIEWDETILGVFCGEYDPVTNTPPLSNNKPGQPGEYYKCIRSGGPSFTEHTYDRYFLSKNEHVRWHPTCGWQRWTTPEEFAEMKLLIGQLPINRDDYEADFVPGQAPIPLE